MLRFALSRIVMAIPTLLIVAVAVFVMIRLIPGDPAQLLLGDLATPAALADLRARLGLDQTWPTQFGIWFGTCCMATWVRPSTPASRCCRWCGTAS